MRKALLVSLLITFVGVLGTSRAEAQGRRGGFLDFIHKLSGPEIWSAGWAFAYCLDDPSGGRRRITHCDTGSWMFRGALGFSTSVSNDPPGSSGDIDMYLFEPTMVRLSSWPGSGDAVNSSFEIGGGLYRFSGTGFRTFYRPAVIVGGAFDFEAFGDWRFYIGPRLRYFNKEFTNQDFGGTPERVGSGGEFSWGVVAGFTF